jgi:hypothetical protein
MQLGGSGVRRLVVLVAAGGVRQQRRCLAALDFGGLGLDARLRPCATLMARLGDKSRLATTATRSMQGVGALAKALPFFGLMTATPSGAVTSLEASIDLLPLLAWYFLPKCKTLTFWLGDGDACGIVPLIRGVARKLVLCQAWRLLTRWRPS